MDPTMNSQPTVIDEDDERDSLSERELEELLTQAIETFADEGEMPGAHLRTFEDAGVLTLNRGLVLRIGDAEFQLTIVRSR